MFTTTSKAKNSYGGRKKRYKKKSRFDRRVEKVATRVVAKQLEEEVEMKAYDRAEIINTVPDTGAIYSLSNTLPQGTGFNQRIGDKIKIKSLYCRVECVANSAATFNNLRVIIFRWLSQGSPVVGDILQLTTGATIRHLSQLNYENRRLYQIKYDNTYLLSDNTAVDIPAVQIDKFFIKNFGDAYWETAATNPVSGHVYMLVISDSPTNLPQIAMTPRVKYTDA